MGWVAAGFGGGSLYYRFTQGLEATRGGVYERELVGAEGRAGE